MTTVHKERTVAARLAARLVRRPNGCLEWTGSTVRGYGRLWVDGRTELTHRVAWSLANDQPVPDGKKIRHYVCDNPPCCEPTHLRPGTLTQNSADMVAKGRQRCQKITHCPQGHEYDETNTYTEPSTGARRCRVCKRAQSVSSVIRRKLQEVST